MIDWQLNMNYFLSNCGKNFKLWEPIDSPKLVTMGINEYPIMIPEGWLNLTLASVEWPLRCQQESHFCVVGKMFQDKGRSKTRKSSLRPQDLTLQRTRSFSNENQKKEVLLAFRVPSVKSSPVLNITSVLLSSLLMSLCWSKLNFTEKEETAMQRRN